MAKNQTQAPESIRAATSPKGPDQPAGANMTAAYAAAAKQDQAQTQQQISQEQAQSLITSTQNQQFPSQPPESVAAATSPAGPDAPAGAADLLPNPADQLAAIADQADTSDEIGTTTGPGLTPPQANTLNSEKDALAQIQLTLEAYGFTGADLASLTNFAWNAIVNGESVNQVTLDIQSNPVFQAKFPEIQYRISHNMPPITVSEILSTQDAYTQTLVSAGINPSTVDMTDLINKDVSPSELNARIQQGYVAVAMAPQDVINAMQNYYGVTKGQLVQYFTNPNANEAQLLQQAAAAQIGGAAAGSGFLGANQANGQMPINQSLALQLAQQGVTYGQAQSGFANLATQAQLYSKLPGQGQVQSGPGGGSPYTASPNQLAEGQFFGGPEEQQLELQAKREEAFFQAGTALGSSGQQTAAGPLQR